MKSSSAIFFSMLLLSGCASMRPSLQVSDMPTRVSLGTADLRDVVANLRVTDNRPVELRASFRVPASGGQIVSYGDDLISPPPIDFVRGILAREIPRLNKTTEIGLERFSVEIFLRESNSDSSTFRLNPAAAMLIPMILLGALPAAAMSSTPIATSYPAGGISFPPNALTTEAVVSIAGNRYRLRTVTGIDKALTAEEMSAQIIDNFVRLVRSLDIPQ